IVRGRLRCKSKQRRTEKSNHHAAFHLHSPRLSLYRTLSKHNLNLRLKICSAWSQNLEQAAGSSAPLNDYRPFATEMALLMFKGRGPAQTERIGRRVVLTLDQEVAAAVVKTKHFVVDVQDIGAEGEALLQPHTALHVDLQMRIQISIPVGALQAP